MRARIVVLAAATTLSFASLAGSSQAEPPTAGAVLSHYADMAQAMYGDAYRAAIDLKAAVETLIAEPSTETLAAARKAWIDARPWYQQTEGFRFGNPLVDDWEGKVNAWPLDEGLIDYVDRGTYGDTSDENPLYVANVIANPTLKVGNDEVDTTTIDAALLSERLQEAGEVETNVATGYHAVEFLLWGQDLNGTGPGAGNRPYTDFDPKNCTGGNCDRRAQYLKAATDLLVADLADMVAAWSQNGEARKQLTSRGEKAGLGAILTGLGSMSYGELAGERMKLGLILHDPEEEHDCFSDNTHNSHFYDQAGMMMIYSGTYERRDGSTLDGPGIGDLAEAVDPKAAKKLEGLMADTAAKMKAIKDKADSGTMAYDQMIGEGNAEGNALVQAGIDALVAQTHGIEAVVASLGVDIKVEGSDSLDNPGSVSP